MGGAVEHAELAGSVEGGEAFATFFGGDFNNGRSAHLEGADLLQALFAIRVTGHEPLGQAALGVTDDQRDTAHQLGAGGDFGVAVFQQFIATVEALVAQAEHIRQGTAVDHVQPLLAWVDEDRLHRLGHLRQLDTLLLAGDFAGHHVFFTAQGQHVQVRTGRTCHHQRGVGDVQRDVFQRATGVIQHDRRFAVRVFDGRADGLLAVRVGHLVGVAEHQGLAIGQTEDHQRAARLVFTNRHDADAGRQRQVDALEFGAGAHVEEQRLAFVGNPHGDLVLFFQRDHQRLARVLYPRRCQRGFLGQRGALEQGRDHVGQEEEDQGDSAEDGKAADQHVPTGQAILERANAALALQLRRIEVNTLGGRSRRHSGIGQIIHAHTLAVLYDRKMTMQ